MFRRFPPIINPNEVSTAGGMLVADGKQFVPATNNSQIVTSSGQIDHVRLPLTNEENFTDLLRLPSTAIWDEWIGQLASGSGAGGSSQSPSSTLGANRRGIILWGTGTTSSGYAGLSTANFTLIGNGEQLYVGDFRTASTISNSSDRFALVFGLTATNSAPQSNNRIQLIYEDDINSGEWLAECNDASSTSTQGMSQRANTSSWYRAAIKVAADGSYAQFGITQDPASGTGIPSFTQTISTHLPSTSTVLNFYMGIFKSVGSNSRSFYTDWAYSRLIRSSPF